MVDFRPFRAIRYNPGVAGPMPTLICPPYDVISSDHERHLLSRNPYNMVRLELREIDGPPPAGRYESAAQAFHRFLSDGALVRDDEPSYYLLRQRFALAGAMLERFALFGALRLEAFGGDGRGGASPSPTGGVLPHEDTAAGPKQDRLALMQHTHANFSPIMGLYRDPGGQVRSVIHRAMATAPLFDFAGDDGQGYTLWHVATPAAVAAVHDALARQPMYIADGHHRYETGVAYRDLQQAVAADANLAHNFILACLIDFDDAGLRNLPYHRVLHDLSDDQLLEAKRLIARTFRRQPLAIASVTAQALASLVGQEPSEVAIGLIEGGGAAPSLLTERPGRRGDEAWDTVEGAVRRVETWVLQERVFRPLLGDALPDYVTYVHDGQDVLDLVRSGAAQLGFLLKGVPFHLFEKVVGAGVRLPRKSTYFSPKLPTGLLINPLDGHL